MDRNKNLLLAIALCAAVLFLWQYFVATPSLKQEQARQAHLSAQVKKPQTASAPGALPSLAAGDQHLARTAALKVGGPRIAIDTPMVDGSILLKGARLDDLRLKKYRETTDPKSPEIVLLAPKSTDYPYYAEFGWVGAGSTPGPDSQWKQVNGGALSPGHPVTLSWDNGHGLTFTRVIAVDSQYMFTVTDSVANKGGAAVTLYPYGAVVRQNIPKTVTSWVLHEGFIGVAGSSEQDAKYTDFKDPGTPPKAFSSTGGWVGITDKYWMAAVVPPQSETFNGEYAGAKTPAGADAFQADYRLGGARRRAGRVRQRGPSPVRRRQGGGYPAQLSGQPAHSWLRQGGGLGLALLPHRPFFWLLDNLYKLCGNFGLAILGLTVIVRLVFFPLQSAGFRAMSKMKKLQPHMEALKKAHKDDPQMLQQQMMELYKREKANPVSGCLPILLTIPVFFSLYKVLFVTIEMRHAPFYGWIHDLSAPDPTSVLNLFGLIPYNPHTVLPSFLAFLSIGAWPILYGITQWVQTKLNPPPPDPVQAKMFAFMPLIFTFMFATFPAGLVIYYAWNNLLSVIQQAFIMKREGVEINLFDNIRGKPKAAND